MTPPMSIFNITKKLQKYSRLEEVIFDGAVAGVMPPIGSTGVEIVANEMEGRLQQQELRKRRPNQTLISETPAFQLTSVQLLTAGSQALICHTQKQSVTSAVMQGQFLMRLFGVRK